MPVDRRRHKSAERHISRPFASAFGSLRAMEEPSHDRRSLPIVGESARATLRQMIYEYRAYTCLPGRLPALLDRFRTTTLGLWEKHGIRTAGFWTVEVGENNQVLHYLLAWESLAEREEKWPAFVADPDWISARVASETPDKIVASIRNEFWRPTDFSTVQ
ncbi:MAG: hypothetical protein JWN39_3637 [Ilumatobacteraceae bacterium]|nr:hypothetical protein [Ilumatobacteraceae bacterium]